MADATNNKNIDEVSKKTSETTNAPDATTVTEAPNASSPEHAVAGSVTEDSTAETISKPASTRTSDKIASKNSAQMIGLALVVAGIIVVGALFATGTISLPGTSDNAATPLSGMNDTDPIAIVNGEKIPKALYNQQYKQTEAMLSSMGGAEQLSDATFRQELQDSLVNDLINAELLYQAAVASDITVSDEDIETEYATTESQVGGPEQLEIQLSVIGLDATTLRNLIRRQLMIERHLEAKLDYKNIEVSDADVQAFYDEKVVAGAPEDSEVPPLEDIKEQIESQIAQDRSAELIDGYIAELRENADVEVLI